MRFSYLFIVTYGRTGSTLLQGILNAVPRTLIRGENNNFLHGLYTAWKTIADLRFKTVQTGVRDAWFGYDNYSRGVFEDDIRRMLRRFLLGPEDPLKYDCLGFKEIRHLDIKDIDAYMDFLLGTFPNSGIVFHWREPAETIKSNWWRNVDPEAGKKKMHAFIDFARAYSAQDPKRTIVTSYEKVIDSGRTDVQRLMDFCGAKLPAARIEQVLSIEHSFGNSRPVGAERKPLKSSP